MKSKEEISHIRSIAAKNSSQKAWETRRKNGNDHKTGTSNGAYKGIETKIKKGLNLSEIAKKSASKEPKSQEHCKKIWQSRRKNGTDKQPGSGKKSIETKRKLGIQIGCTTESAQIGLETKKRNGIKIGNTSESAKRAWKTRRKNGTDKPTNETRKNMRIASLNRVIKNGQFCSIGKNEKQLLDKEEQRIGFPIERQFDTGIGYCVDGYCKDLNRVYEVYEKAHDSKIYEDLNRETEICNHLSSEFHIIWDKELT